MKSKLQRIITYSLFLLILTGCAKEELSKEQNKTNDECCQGCLCGDTIELLRDTETAWTLTKINDEGEYIYDKHSFINFHGTGKNKFAFFKNDKDANPISSLKGDFSINKNNEIVLTPNNDDKKITCRLGEEKNLIAVLNCDNDFGTFTLQKQGTYNVPTSLIETISKTTKMTIKSDKQTKTIKDAKEISNFISIIRESKVWTGPITLPSPLYEINLYNSSNKAIAKIQYNPEHYFNIEINNQSYNIININKEELSKLLSK